MNIITLEGVCKRYELPALFRMPGVRRFLVKHQESHTGFALHDIHLAVKKGSSLGVVGPNSCGKTTLLKIIAGILQPTSGVVKVEGKTIYLPSIHRGVYTDISIEDNLYACGAIYGLKKSDVAGFFKNDELFESLRPYLGLRLHQASRGIFDRALFLLAMSSRADVFLFDEGSVFGDMKFRAQAAERLKKWVSGGRTLLVATHHLSLLENVCSETILLENGEIKQLGETGKILGHYREKYAPTPERPVL